MRALIIIAALMMASTCEAQVILGAGHPSSPQYGRYYSYRPYSYRPSYRYRSYGHMPYGGGVRGWGNSPMELRRLWALEDIADSLRFK